MTNTGIIGHGIVGQAVSHVFKDHNLRIYDKFKESDSLEEVAQSSEFIHICLPTPWKDGNNGPEIDLCYIDENIERVTLYTDDTDKVIIIRSTVVPGTTKTYAQAFPKSNFCFSPEFLTERYYLHDAENPYRNVIGADDKNIGKRVAEIYHQRFPSTPLIVTDSQTAELSKYAANCLGSVKVTYSNVINALCKALDVDHNEVVKIVAMDKRFSIEHLRISKEGGFGGKCFPKDLLALTGKLKSLGLNDEAKFFELVWELNLKYRNPNARDWETIPGAQTGNRNPY